MTDEGGRTPVLKPSSLGTHDLFLHSPNYRPTMKVKEPKGQEYVKPLDTPLNTTGPVKYHFVGLLGPLPDPDP